MSTIDSKIRLWSHEPGAIIKRLYRLGPDSLERACEDLCKDLTMVLLNGSGETVFQDPYKDTPTRMPGQPPLPRIRECALHIENLPAGKGREEYGQLRAQFWFPRERQEEA